MVTQLKLTALENAVAQLQESLEFSTSKAAQDDMRLFKQFRNSVIQCFEFTYELCWKMIERRLTLELPTPSTSAKLGFNDLLREAAQYGLLDNPTRWIHYRRERNITSHTYNEDLAQEVYKTAQEFFIDAQKLLKTLQEKNK